MIPDNNQHVIIGNGYGSLSAYACTLANGKAILAAHLDRLDRDVRDAVAVRADKPNASVYLVNSDKVKKALVELVTGELGRESIYLRALIHGNGPSRSSGKPDERPAELVTEELRNSVVLWAFCKALDPTKLSSALSAHTLNTLAPQDSLAFLCGIVERAKGKTLRYTEPEALDAALELQQLQSGTWKAEAQEHRIVERYLAFVRDNLVDRSDQNYEVSTLAATY